MKYPHLLIYVLLACLGLALPLSGQSRQKGTPVKVSCVGNSITYGLGIEDRERNSYPAQLQALLGSKYLVGNFGKSGATLLRRGHRPYNEQEEYKQALEFGGDIVVVHLGINDTDPRNWPNYRDEFVSDYLQLIADLRSANPKARFLIARLSPIHAHHPRFDSGTRLWHEQIQSAIEQIARQTSGAELIDFYEPLLPYPNLIPDAIHPNAEGAGLLAQTVYSAITGDFGGLRMSALYTDGMVLQRDRPLRISGRANAGERIRLSFGGKRYETTTPRTGSWAITMDALPATSVGQTLEISSPSKRLSYNNVLVGEVWLASGQSNMAYTMKQTDGADRLPALQPDSLLRLYNMQEQWATMPIKWSETALDSVDRLQYYKPTHWQSTTREAAGGFSSVAYTFASRLRDSLGVPVGIICNAIGGSPIESWIDRQTLEREMPAILRHWRGNDFIQPWVRERARENIALRDSILSQRHPYEPTYLYDAGIRPLEHYPIAGVIWYQGESNAHNVEVHERLFPLMLKSWRSYWEDDKLPFYFVQLSSLNRPSWAHFRDSQRRLSESIPNTWMAVSSDHGHPSDVHPRTKEPIGHRLALQALRHTYGREGIVSQGPTYRNARFEAGEAIVRFDYAERMRPAGDSKAIRGFEIAEDFGQYHEVTDVAIADNEIILRHPKVRHPRYVRYGWKPYTDANLVNAEGLPASTFTTELR